MRVAYLCSHYPAISHTFVLREVEALRRLGAQISTFSIRRANPDQLLSALDRSAFATTAAILPPRWKTLLATHLRLAFGSTRAYLSTLLFSLRLSSPGPRGLLWRLFYFLEAGALWRGCEEEGIRHIHAHHANAAADVAMLAAHLGSGIDPRNPWSWSFTRHGPTELYDFRNHHLREKLQDARFVVCISDFARSQMMAMSDPNVWDRFHVVHVGIPVEAFTRAVPVPEATLSILCLGRLAPEKGHVVLLEALAGLVSGGHSVKLTIAGDGPLRARLEQQAVQLGIASHLSLQGSVGQEELRGLYEEASIFCLPSFVEGVPVVLMEAMAMELPVVSSRIAGIPELIDDGQSGILVAPGRRADLEEALAHLLASPELRQGMGSRGRERVEEEFNVDRTGTQLFQLFAEQLSGTGPLPTE
jgi:colanic acid/amylovoran biosynthesis glycosyltransferase